MQKTRTPDTPDDPFGSATGIITGALLGTGIWALMYQLYVLVF